MTTWTDLPRTDAVRRATAVALLAVSALVVLLATTGAGGPVRLLAVVVFALVAPGWAVVAFWRPASAALEWTVATALSIAVQIVLALGMVVTGTWSPVPVFVGLALVTAGVLVLHLRPASAGASA